MYPKYKDIQIPLLLEIRNRGGSTKPSALDDSGKSVYEKVADYFGLSEELRRRTLNETDNRSKWENIIQWVRNDLRKLGFIDNSQKGIWSLTPLAEEKLTEIEFETIGTGQFVSNKREISLDKFLESKKEAERIGELGELFVLDYEKQKLIDINRGDLAEKVRYMSLENVAAGYDILSFNEDGEEMFIEVKSTKHDYMVFEITQNELATAEEYGDSFYLYRITKVGSFQPNIHKFRNLHSLIHSGEFNITPTSWRISLTDKE